MTDQPPDQQPGRPHLRLLSGELDGATPTPPPAEGGGKGKKPKRTRGEIWPGCPVIALGIHGDTCFYLDWLGQLQAVTNHTRDRMRQIFAGRTEFLVEHFPAKGRAKTTSGWQQESTAAAMVRACGEKGVWNAFAKVRGVGAWAGPNGGLVVHCGDRLFYEGRQEPPGEHDGFVYPSAARIPHPLEGSGIADPGGEVLAILETWQWRRADLDAYLLLGWIVAAMFGGALIWRPLCWITGDAGTGKSTVHGLIREIMGGDEAILQSTDATEASVRQVLMYSTIPVALDELEAEADNRRAQAVIKLARQAASGGVVLRGGSEHKAQEFRARSAFLFSSILVPPLLDQDISRIALLELKTLDRGRTSPVIEPAHWRRIGRSMRARVMAEWPRLAPTLELYRAALSAGGHDARGCDQYGTLLAMADLATATTLPDPDHCEQWAGKLTAESVAAQTDRSADWEKMLNHLLGQQIDIYRSGERMTIGRWILAAAGLRDNPDPLKAQNALPAYGMRVGGRGQHAWLMIANSHPGLAGLFRETHWYAAAGQRGGWAQAAKRIPKSDLTEKKSFDGVSSRAFRFPLSSIPNLLDRDMPPPDPSGPQPDRAAADPDEFV